MKMTKTTANKTITLTLVFYGVLFILMPILLNKDMWGSPIFKLLLFITSPLFLFGLWKYEYYKYNKTQINKYNFLGLVIRKYPLNEMKSYKNKVSRNKSTHNPFVFLSYFNKKLRKFIVFNTIQVIFNDNKKLKIDERAMSNKDFMKIKKIIKQSKKQKKVVIL